MGKQQSFIFSDHTGLLKSVSPCCSPLSLFCMMDEKVICHIVAKTDRYPAQILQTDLLWNFSSGTSGYKLTREGEIDPMFKNVVRSLLTEVAGFTS